MSPSTDPPRPRPSPRGEESARPPGPKGESGPPPPRESISRFAGSISLATLISRIAGFGRDVLIARAFGAGMAADAFFVAFAIPSLFRRLFAEGALSASFIPVYTEVRAREGEAAARRFSGGMALLAASALALVCALGVVFAAPLVRALAPGFSGNPAKAGLTAALTRVMFPFLFFIGLWGLATGILNAARRFFIPALAPALQNLVMIGALLAAGAWGAGEGGIFWLAWAVVAGGAVQFVFQLPLIARLGLVPAFSLPWRAPGVGRCLALMGPAAFSAAVFQINILVDRWLASFLAEGSISFLYYANRLVQFPHGLLSLAVASAAFPVLSDRAAEGRRGAGDGGRETLAEAGRLTLYITLPSTFGLMALARPIIEVLFERGAFGPAQTAASAAALRAYASGLVFFGAVRLLAGAYHARLDTRFPMRCASAALAANVVFSVALMIPLGYVGLALATSLAAALNAALLFAGMASRGGEGWPGGELLRAAGRLLLPAAVMGGAVFALNALLWPEGASAWVRAPWLAAEIGAGAALYIWLCGRLAPESAFPWRRLLRRGRRAG